MHQQINIEQLQQALATKYQSTDPFAQLELLKSHYDILQSIKLTLDKRKYISQQIVTGNGINMFHVNNSTIGNILDQSITDQNNTSSNMIFFNEIQEQNPNSNPNNSNRSKFRQQMQSSNISSALRDIQSNCTVDTYQIIKQQMGSIKIKQNEYLEKMTNKLIQERDQLASQLLVLRMEKNNMEKELDKYRKIVAGVDEEKKKLKNKIDYVLKKQNQIFKLQTSFAFKQKINLQLKKRYERLVGSYLTNEAKIEKMYEELDKIWLQICQKMDKVEQCHGETSCWKKGVMKRAKDQLIEQRKLIKQESVHLQKQYEVMSIVSEQFKRIFHEPQRAKQVDRSQLLDVDKSSNQDINSKKSIILEQSQPQVPPLMIGLVSGTSKKSTME